MPRLAFFPTQAETPRVINFPVINLLLWDGRSNIISTSGNNIPLQGVFLPSLRRRALSDTPDLSLLACLLVFRCTQHSVTPASLLVFENTPSNHVSLGLAVLSVRINLISLTEMTHSFTCFRSMSRGFPAGPTANTLCSQC